MKVDRGMVFGLALSREAIIKTSKSESGLLFAFSRFLYEETRKTPDMKRFSFGRDSDSFALSYYYGGIRYKIMKDGSTRISSADPEEAFALVEADLSRIVAQCAAIFLCSAIEDEVERMDAGVEVKGRTSKKGDKRTLLVGVEDRNASVG